VQRAVDRRFNRARYDADQTVAAFAARLKDVVDLDSVRDALASSSVTFRDELAVSSHPQGDGMTHSGAMAVELVRSTRLSPGAPCMLTSARACQPDLIFTPRRLPLDDQGQVIAPADVTAQMRQALAFNPVPILPGPMNPKSAG
jgi:hypothetical protein